MCNPELSSPLPCPVIGISGLTKTQVHNAEIPLTHYNPYIWPLQSLSNLTYDISFLVCTPSLSLETREVRTDIQGRIKIMPDSGLPRQGNLDPIQSRLLVSEVRIL